jgi:hypothetical protein
MLLYHYTFYITYFYYTNYNNLYQLFVQVRVDLGIADHVWQEKRTAIAATVDALGDKFKPELCAGWLGYISEIYLDGRVQQQQHPP